MGQKISPVGLRVGVIRNWDSRWYASGQKFADNICEDYRLRKYVKKAIKKRRCFQSRGWKEQGIRLSSLSGPPGRVL